jgi:mannosyl-oligosaccharide alpha-1,2-mannosidase
MPSRGPEEFGRPQNTALKGSDGPRQTWLGPKWVLMSALIGVLALLAGLYLGNPSVESALSYFRPMTRDSYWGEHREEVKDVFVSSWDAYSKYAWGRLRLSVLSHVQLLGYPHIDNGKIKHF